VTDQDRIEAIRGLGYTEREACFLHLVTLHSGYFLRRQYNQFLEQSRGGNAAALVKKLLKRKHARVESSCDRTLIYHLCRHGFYGLIDQPDNRHRRRRGSIGIKTKVMSLDLILDQRDTDWLSTEHDKQHLLTRKLRIPAIFLPRGYPGPVTSVDAPRYIGERLPIGVTPSAKGHEGSFPPVVSFAYLDPGPSRTQGFETFLRRYFPPFACIRRLTIIYASDSTAGFPRAREAFETFSGHLRTEATSFIRNRIEQILDLLRLEERVRRGGYLANPEQLVATRKLFSGVDIDTLLSLKQRHSEHFIRLAMAPDELSNSRQTTLRCLHLDHDYSPFGAL
jgi:hypothetical protein